MRSLYPEGVNPSLPTESEAIICDRIPRCFAILAQLVPTRTYRPVRAGSNGFARPSHSNL